MPRAIDGYKVCSRRHCRTRRGAQPLSAFPYRLDHPDRQSEMCRHCVAEFLSSPTGGGVGLTHAYIDACTALGCCIKHPDRAQAPWPDSLPEGVFDYGRTLACAECWPKKLSRYRGAARRRSRIKTSGIGGLPFLRRETWADRWRAFPSDFFVSPDYSECVYCQLPVARKGRGPENCGRLTLDHVVPLVRGGHDGWSNLVPACFRCNASKGTKLLWSEWLPPNPSVLLLYWFPDETERLNAAPSTSVSETAS